jgi:hypothetical protein
LTQQNKVTIKDLRNFLKKYMRAQDYDHMVSLIKRKEDFRLVFKLTQLIGETQHVVVSQTSGHFGLQFIPLSVASKPIPDILVPDTIVFVDR